MRGTVHLVGAGPGDPGLLTLRGAELLDQAGAVVFDALVNPALLDRVRPGTELHDVGRRAGCRTLAQEDVNDLLVGLAQRHRTVVRLKGGDPFVFGRGGEEAMALEAAGIPFQVVPGVTSALGALASAGIPVTHRGVSSSVTLITGHRAATHTDPGEGTVVVFMGLRRVASIASGFIRDGRSPQTPVAVVDRGTLPGERTVVGTLADIGERVARAELTGPALIVVGEVVGLRSHVAWRQGGRVGPEEEGGPDAASDRAGERPSPAPALAPALAGAGS